MEHISIWFMFKDPADSDLNNRKLRIWRQ